MVSIKPAASRFLLASFLFLIGFSPMHFVSGQTVPFLIPHLTQAQINALQPTTAGYLVFNTTTNYLCTWNGGSWDCHEAYLPAEISSVAATVSGPGSAMVTAEIIHQGNTAVTERGFQWAIHPGFVSPTTIKAGEGGGSFSAGITGLSPSTTYYVRAYAINTRGTTYSNQTSFQTTAAAPQPPVANQATNIGINHFTASWSSVAGATGYRLDVATNISFTSMVSGYNDRIVSGTSQLVSGLAAGPVYYYRVRAVGAGGTSINSNTITVNLGVQPGFNCGEAISFQYRGSSVTYGTILIQDMCWMDRNLGALKYAEHPHDADAYGHLFQWGRADDGHQIRTSSTSGFTSGSDLPGNRFITTNTHPFDWRIPQNDDLWRSTQGINNPCPEGWRLPTMDELESIRDNNILTDALRFVFDGTRSHSNAGISGVGTLFGIWAYSTSATNAYSLIFDNRDGEAQIVSSYRAFGLGVRCVRTD